RKGEVDIAKLMGKRGNITSTGLRGRPLTGPGGKADIVADVRAKLWPLIADGSVQPIVSTELPIAEAPLAHQLLDSPETVGKVILTVK
ncbi:zinc-binding dehydrogenase, partial [Streptomyces exfoliatus]